MASFASSFVSSFARAFAGVLGRGGGGYGPNLATLAYTSYTMSGTNPPTANVNGIHFSNSASLAAAVHPIVSVDKVAWEVQYEIFSYTSGSVRLIVGGDTANNGFVGTVRNANGIYTERGTTSGTSSIQDQFRLQAAVSSTTLSVRNIVVRRVFD